MLRNITIGILTVTLIAVGYWGYNEKQQKDALVITAENNYQRAFHELAFHIDQIEDQLGSTLAMNTRKQLSPSLADVWRVTSLAQEEMGLLPIDSIDLTETEHFLYKLGKFAYKTSVRDLDKKPLSDKEYETLKNLYDHSRQIRTEIRKSQAMMLARGDRWLDIDEELHASTERSEQSVAGSFEVMNESLEGFSETEWGVELAAIEDLNGELNKALKGDEISEEEAQKIASDYLQLEHHIPIMIEDISDRVEYPAYTVTTNDPDHETYYHIDISKRGGEPIWFLQDRQVEEQQLSLNEAVEIGKQYLQKHEKKHMQLVNSKQYDSVAVLQFTYIQDQARVYTDSITLQVALDDGDILGYEAKDYLLNHKKRKIPKPKLTKEQAQTSVNPKVEIMEDHLAVIKNDEDDEVLCYEFIGVIAEDTYRIFINANDGSEEKVERQKEAEAVYF